MEGVRYRLSRRTDYKSGGILGGKIVMEIRWERVNAIVVAANYLYRQRQ